MIDEYIKYANDINVNEEVFATLTPREKKVLRMRFGIDKENGHASGEVDKDFNVTRERIRQIEERALRKLRHPSRLNKLKKVGNVVYDQLIDEEASVKKLQNKRTKRRNK